MSKATFYDLKKESISGIFNENTKIHFLSGHDAVREIPSAWTKIEYKSYPRFRQIKLPDPGSINVEIGRVIEKRRSVREFGHHKITQKEISKILHYSAGINFRKDNDEYDAFRAYPSAGARYPLEVYVVILKAEDMEPGLYHYDVRSHSLELISKGNFINRIYEYTGRQEMIKNASAVLVISAVFARTQKKYKERGYRYIFLDAGHLAQNVYLISTALKIGCCTVGGFLDNKMNNLLGLDGKEESSIYIGVIGDIYENHEKEEKFP